MGFLGFLRQQRATGMACVSGGRRARRGDLRPGPAAVAVPALIRHRRWEFEAELTSTAVGRPDWSPAMEAWWCIRWETGVSWVWCTRSAELSPAAFNDDVADDVWSLLRRDMDNAAAAGAFLAWKEQPVVWTSAWMP
ncbi:hypothetical protein DAI22_12g098800 [Oryza sativa Japonica Group]|nr:hypothetical protein DAI22_12g098800 [Oryza sativa Japonica Group]